MPRSADPEIIHLEDQRCTLKPKPSNCSSQPFCHSSESPQNLQDQVELGFHYQLFSISLLDCGGGVAQIEP